MSRPDAPLSSLPMIDEEEVQILAQAHGSPIRRHFDLNADLYMVAYRWREDVDRRAEVVFAIQHENGEILLHTKAWYQPTFFRLPSGGIGLNESVEAALYREIAEETGLAVTPQALFGPLHLRLSLWRDPAQLCQLCLPPDHCRGHPPLRGQLGSGGL